MKGGTTVATTTTFAPFTTATSSNVVIVTFPVDPKLVEVENKRRLRGIRARDDRSKWRSR